MPRRLVDDDSNTTCSTGLHVANYDYVKGFGSNTSRIMVIKIHPRDFVAIPVDYNNVKARVCRYEVIEETSNDSLTNKLLVDKLKHHRLNQNTSTSGYSNILKLLTNQPKFGDYIDTKYRTTTY